MGLDWVSIIFGKKAKWFETMFFSINSFPIVSHGFPSFSHWKLTTGSEAQGGASGHLVEVVTVVDYVCVFMSTHTFFYGNIIYIYIYR